MTVCRADAWVRAVSRPAAFIALGLVANVTAAQDTRFYQIGGGFLAGGQIEADAISATNFFYEPRDGLSALGYRLRPDLSLSRNGSLVAMKLDSHLEYRSFDLPGKLDEYLDYGSDAGLSWRPYAKHAYTLTAGYKRGHDQPGLQRTQDGAALLGLREPDEWNHRRVGLGYAYGSPSSRASNELSVGYRDREYVTNRAGTRSLNYDGLGLNYLLAYNYSPRTAVLFSVGHSSTNYELGRLSNGNSRNGQELTVRTGLRWLATGKTSGNVMVGARSYSVDGRSRPAREGLSWRANIDWAVFDTTTLRLSTSQNTVETFIGGADFIDDRSVDLSWGQVWSERFSTSLKLGYLNSDFVGLGRTDETVNVSASGTFMLSRTVSVFAGYGHRERDSTQNGRDYNAPEARVGLRWTP